MGTDNSKPKPTVLMVQPVPLQAPQFSEEQLDYLLRILTPGCCHVSGMHDPTHYRKRPEQLCHLQKARAWQRAVAHLGLAIERAIPEQDCYWCLRNNEGRAEADPPQFAAGQYVDVCYSREGPRRAGNLTLCYWGERDGKNQWLYEIDYDDGKSDGSCAITEDRIHSTDCEAEAVTA